jgi:hypothetical protein
MAVQNIITMDFLEEPTKKNDIIFRVPFIDGGHPNGIRPVENLRNRYYGLLQSAPIARTNPPVKAAFAPVTLDATGFGSTYRLSDESLRQYSLGTYIQNMRGSYYQTRP